MDENETIYHELGVVPALNAAGTKTTFGGGKMREEAADAMREAANSSADISELQAQASKLIQEVTGAEAGLVTTGASSGLTLAAAACIAGDDFGVMERLPNTEGVADEIVIPRVQRNVYDHALRVSGASIVDVGDSSRTLGMTATNVEPWQIADAITEDTAAVACLPRPSTEISVSMVTEVAHEHDVPVILDAAGSLPPHTNLSKFIGMGVDIVSFSGGKAIRAPQSTGFLAGNRDLIRSAALQQLDMGEIANMWDPPEALFNVDDLPGVPRHGIGRGFKVGPENLVGFIRALELFSQEDLDEVRESWVNEANRIKSKLDELEGISVTIADEYSDRTNEVTIRGDVLPSIILTVDAEETGISAETIVDRFKNEDPRILVKTYMAKDGQFYITPLSINEKEADYIIETLSSYLPS